MTISKLKIALEELLRNYPEVADLDVYVSITDENLEDDPFGVQADQVFFLKKVGEKAKVYITG